MVSDKTKRERCPISEGCTIEECPGKASCRTARKDYDAKKYAATKKGVSPQYRGKCIWLMDKDLLDDLNTIQPGETIVIEIKRR